MGEFVETYISALMWTVWEALAIWGVLSHVIQYIRYRTFYADAERPGYTREIALGWASDELDRAIVKGFLAIAPAVMMALRWMQVIHDHPISLWFQPLGLPDIIMQISIGGAIVWLTWWRLRVEFAREVRVKTPTKENG